MVRKYLLRTLFIAAVVASGAAFCVPLFHHADARPMDDAAKMRQLAIEFCLVSPPEAHVDITVKPDRAFAAKVPVDTPPMTALASEVHPVQKGDVVRFVVTSPRLGMLAVHGLLDVVPIEPGKPVSVAFRAIYSGRFPLHFHGVDGSHFEIAALEVQPHAILAASNGS